MTGCENEKVSPTALSTDYKETGIENVKLVEGRLHFTNPDTYFEDVEKIMSMNEQELNDWEASIGFTSMRAAANSAHKAFGKLTSKDQIPAWENEYKDVVTIKDGAVTDNVKLGYYKILANRDGEYSIGQTLARVYPGRTVMIKDGDRSKFSEALEMEKSDHDRGILIVDHGHSQEIQARSSCGTTQTHTGQAEKNNNRQAFLILHVYEETSGSYSWTSVQMHVYGRKKNLGIWMKYDTQHQMQEVNFEAYNNNNVLISRSSDYNGLVLAEVTNFYYNFDIFGDLVLSGYYTNDTKFESAKGRSTTRGTDEHWATICCGGYTNCPQTYGESYFTP
ncbi:hypothetical protein [Membranihabitans maritimus]|uniref:hypothetical protein n=1 Tax=Membranihabitans maritimus TaxID=2904244 RepID=UPI001F16DB6E|nr:hypothetical protein [Membranihabitans maritimus]